MKANKLIALLVLVAMLTALAGCSVQIEITDPSALAALTTVSATLEDDQTPTETGEVQVYAGWYYTVSNGEATIVSTSDAIKASEVILFPAELGGYPVTTIGANGTAVITNASGWVLIPEGVESICHGAFYDLNRTPGWSFPSTMTDLPETALDSCGGVFYAADCPAAQAMGEATGHEVDTSELATVVIAGATYHVPAALADVDLTVYAAVEDESDTAIDVYAAAAAAANVNVPSDSIVDGAVAQGAELPDDVFDEVADVDGEGTNKYISTMGVETGTVYAVDGMLYEMVYITQNVRYATKAQVINAVYETEGLVFGQDYDLIRLYNYVHSYSNGPRPGNFHIYTCYLYKSVGTEITGASTNAQWERAYEHIVDDADQVIQGDVATLMVQAGDTVTVNNLLSCNNTIAYGPSEAANFYGLGSSVLVDGGDTETYKITSYEAIDFGTDDSSLILNDPTIVGTENVLYAVAGGTAYVTGGRYFGCSSGGHGFYVGMGGKIALNSENFIDENGLPVIDYEVLKTLVQDRPGLDLGTAERTELTEDWNAYAAPVFTDVEDEDIAILVTADETGTALTTDTGGGVIVANRLSATTYGRGCAGVYSIGGDESYVFVYNSSLHSNMDSGLVSASNGYIFAFNCDLEGVAGIKTRSGGNGTWAGVEVYNSQIICSFDPDAYDFYDLGSNEDTWEDDAAAYENWTWADDSGFVNAPLLNMFVNKTNCAWGDDISTAQSYWFEDKTTAPQSGEVMACVILTGTAPVTVHSCRFVNENYLNYGDQGATNYLVAGDNGGNGTIYFYDQNADTKWDLTGASDETCELEGDIYVAEVVTMTGPDAGSGPATVNAYFYNSQWSGKTVNWMQNANLTFDATSSWNITGDCGVGDLVLESLDQLTADEPVTLTVYYSLTVGGTPITQDTTAGNVTIVFAEPLEATASTNTSASGGMGSGEM
jgi:hypothetical protein